MKPLLRAAKAKLSSISDAHSFAKGPTVAKWVLSIENRNTRDSYRRDVAHFMAFAGINQSDGFRHVSQAHVLVWRNTLQHLSTSTVRRKLNALASLMDFFCDYKVITHNPVEAIMIRGGTRMRENTKVLKRRREQAIVRHSPDSII